MREGWQGWSTSCQRRGIPRWISWKQKKMKIHHTELDAAQNIIFFASLCTQSIFLHLASITWNLHHTNPPKSSHFKMHITFLCNVHNHTKTKCKKSIVVFRRFMQEMEPLTNHIHEILMNAPGPPPVPGFYLQEHVTNTCCAKNEANQNIFFLWPSTASIHTQTTCIVMSQ